MFQGTNQQQDENIVKYARHMETIKQSLWSRRASSSFPLVVWRMCVKGKPHAMHIIIVWQYASCAFHCGNKHLRSSQDEDPASDPFCSLQFNESDTRDSSMQDQTMAATQDRNQYPCDMSDVSTSGMYMKHVQRITNYACNRSFICMLLHVLFSSLLSTWWQILTLLNSVSPPPPVEPLTLLETYKANPFSRGSFFGPNIGILLSMLLISGISGSLKNLKSEKIGLLATFNELMRQWTSPITLPLVQNKCN